MSSQEDENRTLRMLLLVERESHASARKKLEKAKHDRERYAKRIRFMDERHRVLCALYRAKSKECEILESSLHACESVLVGREKLFENEETQN